MSKQDKKLGQAGEIMADEYLQRGGFKILERNYHTRYGELDIVAQKNEVVHFIEVKTRSGTSYGSAKEALTRSKQHRLWQAGMRYMEQKNVKVSDYQFDLITISKVAGRWQIERWNNIIEAED
ncbi:YraN family protein [Patescibacteria group bacterium]